MTTAERLALEELDTLVLKQGSHTSPVCASPMIGAFLRTWNDHLATDAERTRLILPLVPLVVDTKSSIEVENQRALKVYDWLVRVFTPAWLDLRPELTEHATALRALAPLVDEASARAAHPTSEAAAKAAAAAGDAARDAAWDAVKPTIASLQLSAQDLVRELCAMGKAAA